MALPPLSQIEVLKKQLETVVQDHKYNFRHPSVVSISQELDKLILSVMREKCLTKGR
jgi:hypothetical protein